MARQSWVMDPVTHKLVPKEEYRRADPSQTAMIRKNMEEFKSPISGEVITDPSKLRAHNREHGVTDSRDYSPEYIQTRRIARDNETTGNTEAARNERRQLIHRELKKHGI